MLSSSGHCIPFQHYCVSSKANLLAFSLKCLGFTVIWLTIQCWKYSLPIFWCWHEQYFFYILFTWFIFYTFLKVFLLTENPLSFHTYGFFLAPDESYDTAGLLSIYSTHYLAQPFKQLLHFIYKCWKIILTDLKHAMKFICNKRDHKDNRKNSFSMLKQRKLSVNALWLKINREKKREIWISLFFICTRRKYA